MIESLTIKHENKVDSFQNQKNKRNMIESKNET